MPVLSVTLPDLDALEWTPRSRHLPSILRAIMGAYVLNISPTGDGSFEYTVDGPRRAPRNPPHSFEMAGGHAATLDTAKKGAYGCALYMAMGVLSDLGGNP